MDYASLSPFQQTVREHEDNFYKTFPAAKNAFQYPDVISFVYDRSPDDRGYLPYAPQDTTPIFMPNGHVRDTALIKNPPESIHYSSSGILEPHSPLPTPRLEQAYYPTQPQIYSDAHPPSIARQPESYHVQHPHQYHTLSSPIPQSLVQSPIDASFPSPTSYYPPPPDTPSDIGSSPRSEVDDYQAHVQESVVRPAHSLVPINRAAIKREYLESEEQFPALTIPITTATASLPPPASAPASTHTIPAASTSNFAVSGPARTSRPRQRDGSLYRYPRSLSQQQHGIPTSPASSDLKASHPMSWVDSHTAMSTAGIPGAGMGTAGASRLANAAMRLSPLPSSKRSLEKKPPLACLFCRGRKIACGPPLPGSTDKTCNQCQRRSLACEYPSESRRGMRKKKTDPDASSDANGNNEDPLKTTDENAAQPLASVPTSNPAPQMPLPSSF